MATVSGTFTAVGLSAVLDVPVLEEEITISLTGTWVATVRLERELSPYSGAWETIRTDTGNYSIVIQQKRKNERYRFNTTAFTSGTVTFSVADGDKRVSGTSLLTSDGREVLTYTQAGVQVPGTLTVTGALTLLAASTLASGTTIGNLTLGDGSIVDSSGAISFGDENITTTGTAATGALTVTGAISDTSASSFTTGATIGNVTIADGSITDSGGALDFGNETLTTLGIITAAGNRTTLNVGTAGSECTAVEWGDGYNHITVITCTAADLAPALSSSGAEGIGAVIYTFPSGVYVGNAIHADLTAVVAVGFSNAVDFGFGSLVASGDITTLSTAAMEDWLTGQTIANISSPATEKSTVMTAGAPLLFESGGSHVLNLNMAGTWTAAADTIEATATVTIWWTFLGA